MEERILLVEDDEHLRDGLTELLSEKNYIVNTASTAKSAIEQVEKFIFDLIVLDISLPDGSGLDLCSNWRKQSIKTSIMFLTASDEEFQIVRGLDAGGDDYVTKPFRLQELLSRIRALLRRNTQTVFKQNGLKIDLANFCAYKNDKLLYLTKIEFHILSILLKNKGNIIERKTLLKNIWDDDGVFIEDNTLSVHVSRLREKIGADCIKTIRGIGYKWERQA